MDYLIFLKINYYHNLMNKSYPLSIIIPIYNTEKYIIRCLKSIFIQFNFNIEIILVDDNSSDDSIKLIKKFLKKQKKSHKIKIIKHKKNMGLGPSRNTGIKNSTGKYITFLDSDDLLLKKYSSTIFKLISHGKYDIIEYGFIKFKNNLNKNEFMHLYPFRGSQLTKKIGIDLYLNTVWYASIRIFKKKLWKKIKFPNLYYEDVATIHKVYDRSKSVFFIDKPFLGYRENQNSITSNISIKNYNDMMTVFLSINTNNKIHKKILKIRVARSICYFKNFLKIRDKNYIKIKESIEKIEIPISVLFKLKIPDLLYFKFNLIYEFVDKMRFLLKSK